MSRDPVLRFQNFLFFCLILYQILGKVTNLGIIGSRTKSYRQKTNSACMVNFGMSAMYPTLHIAHGYPKIMIIFIVWTSLENTDFIFVHLCTISMVSYWISPIFVKLNLKILLKPANRVPCKLNFLTTF